MLGHRAASRLRLSQRHTAPANEVEVVQNGPRAEELRRQAEIEQELQLARDIQQGLLLQAVPHLPGWELSAISLPARDIGGDLYDFLPSPAGRQGIMIGDVSGKGLPAALRMAVARTVFRYEARRDTDPASTLAAVNRGVLSEIPHGMVTMLYVLLDPALGSLVLANAGHNYPLLVKQCSQELELSGLPLGVDGDSDYEQLSAVLAPGDTVLLYTDGVTEATNPAGEMFEYERLEQLVQANYRLKPRALVALLLHELRAWGAGSPPSDDITVVVIRRRLASLSDELRGVAEEVLGEERARGLWHDLPGAADTAADVWASLLPELVRQVQTTFGRGLARELNQQLRLVIDEYRV